ncbi:MAG: DUF2461 domain-containing protein [Paludibacteraceae bacterium]|nr:DUF2461 domain-containing protein [Bacteroidales bacterium]MDY4148454.1 DUF2461 domain-containing protein [Paludibacteraceae bacterium]
MADFNLRISLDFLAQLAVNNNRDWFQSHKDWYIEAYSQFLAFSQEYVARLAEVDDNLLGLQAKDCIWRIYRDVRFSADKRPYKEWFGVFPAAKGGKKSLHGGYYVHIQPGHCMFAAGIWSPTPELLKTLRKEIWANYDEIEEIMAQPDFQRYFTDFDTDDMLKKVPQGFDPDFVHADWLKRKSFTFSTPLTDTQVCAPDFMDHIIRIATAAKPLNDFLNYTFEQYGEFPSRCGR